MIFKLYDCEVGFKMNGVSYSFPHVQSVTIDDPEQTRLTRGANAGNNTGLVYKEGLKEPKKVTVPIMGMTMALKTALDSAHDNQTRLEGYCISRTDGSSKMWRQAVLCQPPRQLTLDDSPDSMNVQLIFETFDLSEDHKSD